MKLIYDVCDAEFTQELNEATGDKTYRIKGIFSSPGQKNKNGRVYPMDLWVKEVQNYQNELKNGSSNTLMELNHPARTNVSMMDAVAKMEKLFIKDGYVMGEAVLLNNPQANQLKTLIDHGIKMAVSSRGVGSVKNGLVESYKLITFDIIPDQGQSDFNATMNGMVESYRLNEGIIEDLNFNIDEKGNIHKVCKEDICHVFETSEVQKAILEKFNTILTEAKDEMSDEILNKALINVRSIMTNIINNREDNNIKKNIKKILKMIDDLQK